MLPVLISLSLLLISPFLALAHPKCTFSSPIPSSGALRNVFHTAICCPKTLSPGPRPSHSRNLAAGQGLPPVVLEQACSMGQSKERRPEFPASSGRGL